MKEIRRVFFLLPKKKKIFKGKYSSTKENIHIKRKYSSQYQIAFIRVVAMIHDEGNESLESGSGCFQKQSRIFKFLDDYLEYRAKRGSKKRSFIRRVFSRKTWNWNKMSRWIISTFENLFSCRAGSLHSESITNISYAEDINDFEEFQEDVLVSILSEHDMRMLVEDIIDNAVSLIDKFQKPIDPVFPVDEPLLSKYDMRMLVDEMIDNSVCVMNKFQQSDDLHPSSCPVFKEVPVYGDSNIASASFSDPFFTC